MLDQIVGQNIGVDRTNVEEGYDVINSSSVFQKLPRESVEIAYPVDLEPLSKKFQYFKDRTDEKIRNRVYSFFNRVYTVIDKKGGKGIYRYYPIGKEKDYGDIFKFQEKIETTWTESYYESEVVEKIRIGIKNILDRLRRFASLEKGWDGYQGKPINIRTVIKALNFFSFVLYFLYQKRRPDFPLPFIAPVSDGGIQFEWETCYKELITYIPEKDDDSFQYLKIYRNLWGEEEEEGEISSIIELSLLTVEWLT